MTKVIVFTNPLSDEQRGVMRYVQRILDNGGVAVINGPAGSGKSHILSYLLAGYHHRAHVAAFTNKACGVVNNFLESRGQGSHALTIHRLLDKRSVGKDGGKLQFTPPNCGLIHEPVFIDECSMINDAIYDELMNVCVGGVCFLGDRLQLPPVGQREAAPFVRVPSDNQFNLTEVFRQGNDSGLASLLRLLRKHMLDKGMAGSGLDDLINRALRGGLEGVSIMSKGRAMNFAGDMNGAYLSYLNKDVDRFNDHFDGYDTVMGCTIHKSQGSQYDDVIFDLDSLTDGSLHNDAPMRWRLAYVAMSRAVKRLVIATDRFC